MPRNKARPAGKGHPLAKGRNTVPGRVFRSLRAPRSRALPVLALLQRAWPFGFKRRLARTRLRDAEMLRTFVKGH